MPSPILARADALMQRRRQPEAEADDVPILTDAIDDYIPLLVDEETPPAPVLPPIAEATAPAEATADPELIEQLARELACRVEQRLVAELPRLIESTVRDFLAEQQMLADLRSRN